MVCTVRMVTLPLVGEASESHLLPAEVLLHVKV